MVRRIAHTGGHSSIRNAKGGGGGLGDAPDYVASTSGQTSSGNPSMTLPTGWAAGDILLGGIIALSTGARPGWTPPPNFISLGNYSGLPIVGSSNWSLTVFAKRAELGEITPVPVFVAPSGTASATWVLSAYRPTKPDWDLQFDQLPIPNAPVNGSPGLVTTKSGIAKRRSRLIVMSACSVGQGAATVPTPPTGLTQRENYLYNGFHRMYCWDGVVAKGDQISRAVQWSPFLNNQIVGTFSILL